MFNVGNSRISLRFDAPIGGGLSLVRIKDVLSGQLWLREADRGMLFEFARGTIDDNGVILDGPARQSNTALVIDSAYQPVPNGTLHITARAPDDDKLTFGIAISPDARGDGACWSVCTWRTPARTACFCD